MTHAFDFLINFCFFVIFFLVVQRIDFILNLSLCTVTDSFFTAEHSTAQQMLKIMFLHLAMRQCICCHLSSIYYLTDCYIWVSNIVPRSDRHHHHQTFSIQKDKKCLSNVCNEFRTFNIVDFYRLIQPVWIVWVAWISHWMSLSDFWMATTATMCFVVSFHFMSV